MIVSIHQPCPLYYIGFWNKFLLSDIHIIYDDVRASKYDHTNRFKLKSPQGKAHYITLPVRKKNGVQINQMEFQYSDKWDWRDKIRKTIRPWYRKAPYFEEVYPLIDSVLNELFSRVIHFTLLLFYRVAQYLGIQRKMYFSSRLGYNFQRGGERLASLTKAVGGSIYLSGAGGYHYIDPTAFHNQDVHLAFQRFNHPHYRQLYHGMVEYLSILDLLFNEGKHRAVEIIRKAGVISHAETVRSVIMR